MGIVPIIRRRLSNILYLIASYREFLSTHTEQYNTSLIYQQIYNLNPIYQPSIYYIQHNTDDAVRNPYQLLSLIKQLFNKTTNVGKRGFHPLVFMVANSQLKVIVI